MIFALHVLGLLAYLVVGAVLSRYINAQPAYAGFKDRPGYIGSLALIWPIVIGLSIIFILVPNTVIWFGRFILGTRSSS